MKFKMCKIMQIDNLVYHKDRDRLRKMSMNQNWKGHSYLKILRVN
jgi:hypothetical protein